MHRAMASVNTRQHSGAQSYSLQPHARACSGVGPHGQRHQHGVVAAIRAGQVAQLVGAPEAVLLLRAVVLHLPRAQAPTFANRRLPSVGAAALELTWPLVVCTNAELECEWQ
jgi:hypothetical protein